MRRSASIIVTQVPLSSRRAPTAFTAPRGDSGRPAHEAGKRRRAGPVDIAAALRRARLGALEKARAQKRSNSLMSASWVDRREHPTLRWIAGPDDGGLPSPDSVHRPTLEAGSLGLQPRVERRLISDSRPDSLGRGGGTYG